MSGKTDGREVWGSKVGFIMAAAGSAVGLGNVWRFPYLCGMNGGAAFLFVYIALAVTVGTTIMLAEFCIGRATRLNAASAFRHLSGSPIWHIAGWCGFISGGYVILSYYGIIGGWTIKYAIHSLTGLIDLAAEGKSGDVLGEFLADTKLVVMFQAVAMAITTWIVASGVGGGIERACKVLMPMLFVLLLILIGRALTLDGAMKGLEFYLKPDFSKLTGRSVLDALGQSFYSLSLGMGIMVTYGSYIGKDEKLHTSGLQILTLDTFIAFLAGLVIFPAVFAMGVEPSQGIGLTFVALPGVFAKMPGGSVFSFMFFVLLAFAALTSMMSLLEVAVSFSMDEFKLGRKAAAWISGVVITLIGLPSALSLADEKTWSVAGLPFLDFMDSISNNVMMPIAAIGASLYVGWKWADKARFEITNGGTIKFSALELWMVSLRFFAPVMIAVILVSGWPFAWPGNWIKPMLGM